MFIPKSLAASALLPFVLRRAFLIKIEEEAQRLKEVIKEQMEEDAQND
jgi:hypothetical protein